MAWPTSTDYYAAVQHLRVSAGDGELRGGEVARTPQRKLLVWTGNFADVYRIDCPAAGNSWALKCFTREIPGLEDRYRLIAAHLREARLPFTVDFQWLEQGLRIHGQWFPALKMRWVEGLTLTQYAEKYLEQPQNLRLLLGPWVKLAAMLREAGIAHADLQHGNVLLVPQGDALALRLIDYDGMWVPALANSRSGELGHPAYQHPQRLREGTYNAHVDRFSHLAIYTAIRCLMIGRGELWQRFSNGDNFLFREEDFRKPSNSQLFQALWQQDNAEAQSLVGRLILACGQRLEEVPWIDELASNGQVRALTGKEERAVAEALGGREATREVDDGKVRLPAAIRAPVATAVPPLPLGRPNESLPPRLLRGLIWPFRAADRVLGKLAGEGNELLHNFLRFGATLVLAVCIAWILMLGVPWGRTGFSRGQQPELANLGGLAAPEDWSDWAESPGPPEKRFKARPPPTGNLRRRWYPPRPSNATLCPAGSLQLAPCDVQRVEAGSTLTLPVLVKDSARWRGRLSYRLTGSSLPGASIDPHTGLFTWKVSPSQDRGQYQVTVAVDGPAGQSDQTSFVAMVSSAASAVEFPHEKLRTFQGHRGAVTSVAFSPDGRHVLTGSSDGDAVLWDAATAKRVRTFKGHSPVFSPDGRWVLTLSSDTKATRGDSNRKATLWDAATAERLRTFQGHFRLFSPDGQQVLTLSSEGGPIFLWDAATAKRLRIFPGDSPVFSPDGRWVLTLCSDRKSTHNGNSITEAILWDAATAKRLRAFEGQNRRSVNRVAFSPDGRHVLTANGEHAAILWDAATAKELCDFQGHNGRIDSLAFSPDGRYVLTGSSDGKSILWNAATGERLRTFSGHCGLFSPDGRHVLTANGEHAAILWDVVRAARLRTFQVQTLLPAPSMAFSRDGLQLLTGTSDGVILWNVAATATLPPVGALHLALIAAKTVEIGKSVSVAISVEDAQRWKGKLRFTLGPNTPAGARIDPQTGLFTWAPTFEHLPGKHDVTVSVEGPDELGDQTTFTISVTRPLSPEIAFDLGNGVKLELVRIAAGEYAMGDDSSRWPIHMVRITKPFYLGKYEVTQEQWEAVMGDNPCTFKGPKNPVETVSWNDCQAFLAKLNEKHGTAGMKFSLPTEAQWEYACRAGSTTEYYFGDDEFQLGEYAWYRKNSGSETHPVGGKKPNRWGLYDMYGNVLERCADEGHYAISPTDDPEDPAHDRAGVVRGGSTICGAGLCRSAVSNSSTVYRVSAIGFRASLIWAE